MPTDHFDFRNAKISGSVVGAHMQNIKNTIEQLPSERAELRSALEALRAQVEHLLQQLPSDSAKKAAARNLEDFSKEAVDPEPRKSFLEVTSKGLIDAASTVAVISGPIIETVNALRGLLGF
jgi:signal transduction protein with GAF and PtsI domain